MMNNLKKKLREWFDVENRGTNLTTEFRAGFVNFLANFYLIIVVPQLLNKNNNGFNEKNTAVAFVLTTFAASIVSGVFSNLPIPLGPGLGGSTFLAYSVLDGLSEQISRQDRKEALTICFLSGILMFILSPLAILLVSLSPDSVKTAIPVGLGMIFALNGFLSCKLIETDANVGLTQHSFSVETVLAMVGLTVIALLHQKGFHTGMLIPIVSITLISWIFKISPWPSAVVDVPSLGSFDISLSSVKDHVGKCTLSVFGLYLIAIFDIFGIAYGVSLAAGLVRPASSSSKEHPLLDDDMEEKKQEDYNERNEDHDKDEIQGLPTVFVTCSLATIVSSCLGCTPVIALGESFAGVLAGGRTGLTAVSFGIFMILTLPFLPIVSAIPDFATSPVLIILGVNLMALTKHCDFDSTVKAVPSYLTIVLMPFLMSIDRAILIGLCAHVVLYILDFVYVKLFGHETSSEHEHQGEDEKQSALERSTTRMIEEIRSAVKSPSSTPRLIPRRLSQNASQLMSSSFHGKSPSSFRS